MDAEFMTLLSTTASQVLLSHSLLMTMSDCIGVKLYAARREYALHQPPVATRFPANSGQVPVGSWTLP
jgi:hypothetical protein